MSSVPGGTTTAASTAPAGAGAGSGSGAVPVADAGQSGPSPTTTTTTAPPVPVSGPRRQTLQGTLTAAQPTTHVALSTDAGPVDVTASWSDGSDLALSLQCPGGQGSRTGASGTAVSATSTGGTCYVDLTADAPRDRSPTCSSSTIRDDPSPPGGRGRGRGPLGPRGLPRGTGGAGRPARDAGPTRRRPPGALVAPRRLRRGRCRGLGAVGVPVRTGRARRGCRGARRSVAAALGRSDGGGHGRPHRRRRAHRRPMGPGRRRCVRGDRGGAAGSGHADGSRRRARRPGRPRRPGHGHGHGHGPAAATTRALRRRTRRVTLARRPTCPRRRQRLAAPGPPQRGPGHGRRRPSGRRQPGPGGMDDGGGRPRPDRRRRPGPTSAGAARPGPPARAGGARPGHGGCGGGGAPGPTSAAA